MDTGSRMADSRPDVGENRKEKKTRRCIDKVGYMEHSSFTKSFKQVFGLTP